MIIVPYQEALDAATNFTDDDILVTPITAGLINNTYKITVKSNGYRFLLQEINREVFPEPFNVQANYEAIWGYLYYEGAPRNIPYPITIPKPYDFMDGSKLFCDSTERYWRKFEFIDRANTVFKTTSPAQAKRVAQTFACLTASFEFFDTDKLHVIIPGFHDLSLRFRQFQESLGKRNYERILKAAPLINELKKREKYISFYEVITESEEFEKRVMHHDAKISNILFDEETGEVICPVDMDTCMPGYFFSDLGDMLRSMLSTEDESSLNFEEIGIRKDFYEAIVSGYLGIMDEQLTDSEKKYIHSAGLLMIYMQALRFLTDYLENDIYYKCDYPGQNFDRAKNQLFLLQKLELFLKDTYSFSL